MKIFYSAKRVVAVLGVLVMVLSGPSVSGQTTGEGVCGNNSVPSRETVPSGFSPQSTHLPDGGITLPWDIDENMPVIPVMLNGEGPFRFLVDTGASTVMIDQRLADRLGMTRHGEAVNARSAANEFVSTGQPAVIRSLGIGDAHFHEFKAHVLDFSRMEIDGDMYMLIDGIVGSALFAHALLTIDYPKRSLQLTSGSLPDLNTKYIFPLLPGPSLSLGGSAPYVKVRMETATQSQEHWALIDTGNNGTLRVGPE